jgi:predicted metal-dependent hydrolase
MATITVSAPQYLDEESIRTIVQKKARWILEKQEQIKRRRDSHPAKEYVSGESFPYLGREYRLKIIRSSLEHKNRCRLVNERLLVEIDGKAEGKEEKTVVKNALMDWYREEAEKKIFERINYYTRLIGKQPKSIKIRSHKRQWGSCSGNGNVRFNWKIIMTPISVLDYVIVHELCHLIYPHHSSQFWQKVQSIIPDYKKKRDLLKEYSYQMEGIS